MSWLALEFDPEQSIQRVGRAVGSAISPRGRHRGKPLAPQATASESGTQIRELDESDLIACADDEFLCSEALTLWGMIRKARARPSFGGGAGKRQIHYDLPQVDRVLEGETMSC